MRRGSIVAAVLTAAALVLVAAACGGGKSAAPTTTTTSGATGATGATGSTGPTGAGPTGSTGTGFASAKNCHDLGLIAAKIASAIGASGGSNSIQTVQAEMTALANAAPDDIKGDFQTFAAAFTTFATALQKAGYTPGSTTPPTAAQLAALAVAAKALETPQVKAAEKHLQAWGSKNCTGLHY